MISALYFFVEVYENAPVTLNRDKVYTNAAFDDNHYEDTQACSIEYAKQKVCLPYLNTLKILVLKEG